MPYRTTRGSVGNPNLSALGGEIGLDAEMKDVTNTGEQKSVPAWLSKIKEGGVKKVPKDVQKRRRNFRLKKMLTPKPPMMVLYELVNNTDIQFQPYVPDQVNKLLKISATYDGQTFEGIGPNKSIAKNICSERILQHIAFKSCTKTEHEQEHVQTEHEPEHVQSEQENNKGAFGEEETPWTALASVALFKLFNDWEAQGATLPPELMKSKRMGMAQDSDEPMEGVSVKEEVSYQRENGEEKKKKEPKEKKPKGPKTLPADPTSRHPVQLLNEMEGQLEYLTTLEGAPPNTLYTFTVVHCDNKYTGTAKNKKEAKKLAAQAALAAIHNVFYPEA